MKPQIRGHNLPRLAQNLQQDPFILQLLWVIILSSLEDWQEIINILRTFTYISQVQSDGDIIDLNTHQQLTLWSQSIALDPQNQLLMY